MKPFNLILSFCMLVLTSLFMGPALAAAVGAEALLTSGALVAAGTAFGGIKMAMGYGSPALFDIVTTQLESEYGAYYVQGSQNERNLYTQLFESAKFDELFEQELTDDTVHRDSLVTIGAVTQPFQLAWTPTGNSTFKPAPIPLFELKVDFEESSYKVEKTWAGFLHKEGLDESQQPLPVWLLEKLVVPRHIHDVELNGCFNGVYAAPTAGTPGAVGTMMNGVKKVINDGITATTISTIATGAPNADPVLWVGQVEAFVAGIDSKDRKTPMKLAMSEDLALRFKRGNRAKYNMQHNQLNELMAIADYPNIMVEGYAAMGSSTKIFCSPKSNSKMPVKKNSQRSRFKFETVDRRLKAWTDYWKGYGFVDHSRVYTNDQDT